MFMLKTDRKFSFPVTCLLKAFVSITWKQLEGAVARQNGGTLQ